jgi:hypothetical protein
VSDKGFEIVRDGYLRLDGDRAAEQLDQVMNRLRLRQTAGERSRRAREDHGGTGIFSCRSDALQGRCARVCRRATRGGRVCAAHG